MEFSDKRVLVVGLGRSGIAASYKLRSLGAYVCASDSSQNDSMLKLASELRESGIEVILGVQDENLLGEVDLVVVSPGVPSRVQVIESAKARAITVLSEIEFAYQLTDRPIIAITGTNGKTTTTTLIGKVFEAAKKPAVVAGNIGTPLVEAVGEAGIETLIVEVSSFQLDTIIDFRPKISVLLNVTEDHLDWHPDFDDYVDAKNRLFINQIADDIAVLNLDDEVVRSLAANIKAKVLGTSKHRELDQGVFARNGRIVARLANDIDTDIDICGSEELRIRGSHNLDNVMAVIAVCLSAGIDASIIRQVITEFPGLRHRIEYVTSVNGVEYYDDSKATNVDATIKALTAFREPVILLVGGRNKGNNFEPLAQSIDMQVKVVIGFGEAGHEILSAMPKDTLKHYAERVEDAVLLAHNLARPGQVVLFSPSCASFDAFQGYAQRGDAFKKAVLELGDGNVENKN